MSESEEVSSITEEKTDEKVVSLSSAKASSKSKSDSSFNFEEVEAANRLKKQKMEEERKKHNVSVKRSYRLTPKR